MRWIINILLAVMVLALLGGGGLYLHQHHQHRQTVQSARKALNRLKSVAMYQRVLVGVDSNDTAPYHQYPRYLKLTWFENAVPTNPLANDRPWMDIAPEDATRAHPPDPVLTTPTQGGFWYNPTNGICRARVPAQTKPDATLALYNQVNNTSLSQLPSQAKRNNKNAKESDVPNTPGPETYSLNRARQLAKQDNLSKTKTTKE
jgi:hypothetical protein